MANKPQYESTEYQLARHGDKHVPYAYVETVEAEYRGLTLDQAMRVWFSYAKHDVSRVINVGTQGFKMD